MAAIIEIGVTTALVAYIISSLFYFQVLESAKTPCCILGLSPP